MRPLLTPSGLIIQNVRSNLILPTEGWTFEFMKKYLVTPEGEPVGVIANKKKDADLNKDLGEIANEAKAGKISNTT